MPTQGNDGYDNNNHSSIYNHGALLFLGSFYNSIYLTPFRHFRSIFLRYCNESRALFFIISAFLPREIPFAGEYVGAKDPYLAKHSHN